MAEAVEAKRRDLKSMVRECMLRCRSTKGTKLLQKMLLLMMIQNPEVQVLYVSGRKTHRRRVTVEKKC